MEPLAFHLHKNRRFFSKIKLPKLSRTNDLSQNHSVDAISKFKKQPLAINDTMALHNNSRVAMNNIGIVDLKRNFRTPYRQRIGSIFGNINGNGNSSVDQNKREKMSKSVLTTHVRRKPLKLKLQNSGHTSPKRSLETVTVPEPDNYYTNSSSK